MTTKTISGTYRAGSTLSPAYGVLDVTSSCLVTGVGVVATAPATLSDLVALHGHLA